MKHCLLDILHFFVCYLLLVLPHHPGHYDKYDDVGEYDENNWYYERPYEFGFRIQEAPEVTKQ